MARLSDKKAEQLWDELGLKPKMIWDHLTAAEEKNVEAMAKDYMAFIDVCRTERLTARRLVDRAGESGFQPVGAGADRILINHRGKAVALAWLGQRPVEEGLRLIGSHIDAPRLDMKAMPLYEEAEVAFLKSQYYGGVRKYHWLARPLALIGVAVLANGTSVDVEIGLKPDDPVLTVADLLPHLARKAQGDKKLSEAFEGEKLNLVLGSRPLGGEKVKDRFKLAALKLLNDQFGITEPDLISAELEAVPADSAREVGLDRALIGAYGHDDRACAYASLVAAEQALAGDKRPERPGLILFMDKEEIGSEGNTSAQSKLMAHAVGKLIEASGQAPSNWAVSEALFNSRALSSDVAPALDPDYQEVHEKRNAAKLGYGPCVVKYTGHGGKYSASDANAEYMGWLRNLLNDKKIIWQAGGLGKVDEGGGGTIAMYLAKFGMEIVDFGMPILGMHSPFELMSKADLYMTVEAMKAFLEAD